jgi:adenylosuccinate lyase
LQKINEKKMITSISPIDGRYEEKVKNLQSFFSEFGLIKYRVKVEIEWFIHLSSTLDEITEFSNSQITELRKIYESFSVEDAEKVKATEKTTNHDVKAVEYFIKEKIKGTDFELYSEFIHFSCTSEDINNLSYAMMFQDAFKSEILVKQNELIEKLFKLSETWKAVPMLSRTHGQTASPTTVGKEFMNLAYRLHRKHNQIKSQEYLGKINGAVGNYNAHLSAYPELNWINISKDFIETKLGLQQNPFTTQIEPHDFIAELCHKMKEFNTILIDLNRDIWSYISIGFFKQKLKDGEIGSSTMPHKVNPIDFENSEGNLGFASSMLNHFAEKLPISRWQRDLTDSTVFRNIGMAFSYSVLAIDSTLKGLNKLELNPKKIEDDLNSAWEVLAEPIQTVMRKYKIDNAYEKLKELTRGQTINQNIIVKFVESLDLPQTEKNRLKTLSPATYVGNAKEQVEDFLKSIK